MEKWGPSAGEPLVAILSCKKRDRRSNRQASGTGVILVKGSSMLKSRNGCEYLHKVLIWDFVQITMVLIRVQGLGSTI
ncbi:unnamed protein product [Prunus armeniaca]